MNVPVASDRMLYLFGSDYLFNSMLFHAYERNKLTLMVYPHPLMLIDLIIFSSIIQMSLPYIVVPSIHRVEELLLLIYWRESVWEHYYHRYDFSNVFFQTMKYVAREIFQCITN